MLFFGEGGQPLGVGCLVRLCNLRPLGQSNPNWMWPWATQIHQGLDWMVFRVTSNLSPLVTPQYTVQYNYCADTVS